MDFTITIGEDNKPTQTFNNKEYKLHNGERYFNRGNKKMHWVVWEFYNGKRNKGFHIHHINENSWDNRIENLEEIKSSNHLQEHMKNRMINNPEWFIEFQKKGVETAKEWHKSEDGLEWHKQQSIKSWENREYKIKVCEECGKEYETRHSGISKFCHQNCKQRNRTKRLKINS